jgi:hypothetical protein
VPVTVLRIYRVLFIVAFIFAASICTHSLTNHLSIVPAASVAGGLAFVGVILASLIFRQ